MTTSRSYYSGEQGIKGKVHSVGFAGYFYTNGIQLKSTATMAFIEKRSNAKLAQEMSFIWLQWKKNVFAPNQE